MSLQCAHSNEPTKDRTGEASYALSSWNYGSFNHCNPFYRRREQKENISPKRSQSANLNQYGKRVLAQEERIVTEDYLIMMMLIY